MPHHAEWTEAQDTTTVTVDTHDLEVAYYDEGTGDPVVFLHGIPSWSFLWRDIVPSIADERRVIVPDMVGYGNSATHDGFDRSIRAQEAMVHDLLDGLGIDTVSFVGHDIGGGVGLRYAAHRPDAIDRLVLSNAACYDSWPVEFVLDLGLPGAIEDTSVEDVRSMLGERYEATLYGDDPSEEFVEGMTAQWHSEESITSLGRNSIATNTNHTTEIDYTAITAETLLLWGAEDESQPISSAYRLQEDLDTTELVGLDEANHWVIEDRTDAYREELRSFLLD